MGKQAAFSGIKELHAKGGSPEDINYFEFTRSDHWNGTVFTVPEAGFYAFHMSFMRDTTDQEDSKDGEGDDCNIKIYINGFPKEGAYVSVGENSVPRSSGAASFVLELKAKDKVTTRDWMYEDKYRVFRHIVFTGYKVA